MGFLKHGGPFRGVSICVNQQAPLQKTWVRSSWDLQGLVSAAITYGSGVVQVTRNTAEHGSDVLEFLEIIPIQSLIRTLLICLQSLLRPWVPEAPL